MYLCPRPIATRPASSIAADEGSGTAAGAKLSLQSVLDSDDTENGTEAPSNVTLVVPSQYAEWDASTTP
jgi:hypothetical protein